MLTALLIFSLVILRLKIKDITCSYNNYVICLGIVGVFKEKDETRKEALKETFAKETLPMILGQLEKLLVKNGGKYFVGNDVTWADLEVANVLSNMEAQHGEGVFGPNSKLKDHTHHILNLPKIKEWIEKRPKTAM